MPRLIADRVVRSRGRCPARADDMAEAARRIARHAEG
jgi:hypothetical protein